MGVFDTVDTGVLHGGLICYFRFSNLTTDEHGRTQTCTDGHNYQSPVSSYQSIRLRYEPDFASLKLRLKAPPKEGDVQITTPPSAAPG